MSDLNLISQLRQQTGAGMLAVKNALEEAGGNAEKAIEILRKSGAIKAAKKAERATSQGAIGSYIHGNGSIGVLVEVACETDFVSRNEQFRALVHDLAMHIAALNPLYISRNDVSNEIIEKEKDIYREEVSGKPSEIVEKIVQGKLDKFYKETCLLEQDYMKDDSLTVEQFIQSKVLSLGENIRVVRFCRFAMNAETQVCG